MGVRAAYGELSTPKKWALKGAAVAGAVLALTAESVPDRTNIQHAGQGTINYLNFTPGKYCNVKAGVGMEGVATRYSHFVGSVVLGAHIGVTAWVQRSMSGEIEAQACVQTSAMRRAEGDGKGHYTVTLKTSDFSLIEYPKDPVQMKFNTTSNWVQNLDNATLGNLETDLNLIPGVHFTGNEDVMARLDAIDLEQAYNYISTECGTEIINRVTAAGLPGGNMQQRMVADMIKSTPGAAGVVDPKNIDFKIIHDTNTIPNQYSDQFGVFEQEDGLSFPSAKDMATCKDIVKEIGHES